MSKQEVALNTGSQVTTNYNLAKIFVYNNRYINGNYINSTYDDVTLQAGTLMGRVLADGTVKPLQSNATDGSQIPLGVLAADLVVVGGDSVDVPICTSGDVVEAQVILTKSGDTMNTIIEARRLRDRIAGDTVGVNLVGTNENTYLDNQ